MFSKGRPVGESFVWFTSMGLAIGLLMVVFLLGLIIANGIKVFWPDKTALIKLKEGSSAAVNNQPYLAGNIIKTQEKLGTRGSANPEHELQIFIGNKDIYGIGFKFINQHEVAEIRHPKEIIEIERLEYGDAIGIPQNLQLEGSTLIPASNAKFNEELTKRVKEVRSRWDEIRDIEKSQIGAINRSMERLQIKKKNLRSNDSAGLKHIEGNLTKLQAEYEVLAARASQLRDKQFVDHLKYKLVTGEEKDLPVGQIVSYFYPNQLSTFQRLGLFFHRLWGFVSDEPREANTEGGIFPAIFGTFTMTLLLSIAVTPFGVLAAIYLREYAKQGVFVRSVRIAVNNLAGVPSIVFGVFGLGFFVYLMGGAIDRLFFSDVLPTPTFGTGGILWAALTLALMTVPVVIVATEEALAAVPRGTREGSLACGASKWQTIQRVVLPASAPGILTGLILAMARGAGEVAPLMLVGVVKLAPSLPLDTVYPFIHLDQKFMHLGFHIYDLGFQSPDSEAAKPMVFATTFFLILLVVVLNLGAIVIRDRLRKKYSTGAF
ncbi:MAG TPA: phosphate ABC transporter permease PstA [Acidobacteriota bacterium]|nr:phosphate ABC transporter permease PstA [Acidobacteriota bacterium]